MCKEVAAMNYIVLDMEWNQPWPGSPSAKKVLPVSIRGVDGGPAGGG